MESYVNRIKTLLAILEKARYEQPHVPQQIYQKSINYHQRDTMYEAVTASGWLLFKNGAQWGGYDSHRCFKAFFTIPKEMDKQEIWLRVSTGAFDPWNTDNPQFLVYINGIMECGMDMNHQEVCIAKQAIADACIEIGLYAYSNNDITQNVLSLAVMIKHPEVEQLYYDCKVLYEVAMELQEEDWHRSNIIEVLNQVANQLELRKNCTTEAFLTSVTEARNWLLENYYKTQTDSSSVRVHSIGHTHIDVAWKWPLRQTREKVLRSFATVLHLMKEYPEYRFLSSQPQLYEFVKEESPELYAQIKEKIREGKWEAEGSMWVEPDCNLTSGESLVRQILYGKRFFAKEFGVKDNKILWLPDVFGYSAAMPQILKKAGISYFMTTKINWNEYNKFPNDVMYWTGIDGTRILTYFISTTEHIAYPELQKKTGHATTYNGKQNVSQVMGTWQRFSNKNLTRGVLTCYGFGDGGGGPTAQMLEESRRMEQGIYGCPVTKQTFAGEFFKQLEENLANQKVPTWNGELYLEYHRGTYTSMARNKKYNRQCEFLNADAEFFAVMALLQEADNENPSYHYPKETLDSVWKLTLLNQFHDILPGSSIEEVYQDAKAQYEEIIASDYKMIQEALATCGQELSQVEKQIQESATLVFYNTSGVTKQSYALLTLKQYEVLVQNGYHGISQQVADAYQLLFLPSIKAKGYLTSDALIQHSQESTVSPTGIFTKTATGYQLDTKYYQVSFLNNGEISRLYDKEFQRDVQKTDEILNQLIAFEDKPYEYDAWNIDSYYEEKFWIVSELTSFSLEDNGPLLCRIRITRPFMCSFIQQDICFYQHSRRIDFKTTIDWKEEQILLKAAFPIDVISNKLVCDIQFGNVERSTHRNTSWEQAKFELCAHKWVDLAEHGYGVALLNDCKYGLDVEDTTVRLTLLKSGIFPNPNADKELHVFTYSLYPHAGDFREGKVVQESFSLNQPIYTAISRTKPVFGDAFAAVTLDCENVVLDTMKRAEEGEELILRMYETYGKRSQVRCSLASMHAKSVMLCNLLEQDIQPVALRQETFCFEIKPYEIVTFKIRR